MNLKFPWIRLHPVGKLHLKVLGVKKGVVKITGYKNSTCQLIFLFDHTELCIYKKGFDNTPSTQATL